MNHDNTTETITHLSLCSGYEGIGLGLKRVLRNVREVAYVEIEAFAIANLVDKIEKGWLDAAPIYTNLKTFPYRKFLGRVDILSGGFPCQPFSQAGLKQATEDPRHLFPYIAEGIRQCKPKLVFLENVLGILSCKTGDGEPVLKYVLRTLEEMGYKAEAGIFSSSEVGAPNQRKRVFILAMANTYWDGYIKNQGGDSEEDGVSEEHRKKVHGRVLDGASDELGNTQGVGLTETEGANQRRECEPHNEHEVRNILGATSDTTISKLGYTNGKRLQRLAKRQGWKGYDSWQTSEWMDTQYPSRPNEPQKEWEAPRVLVNTKGECNGLNETERQGGNTTSTTSKGESTKGLSKPRLGRATDGFANRVDRLRLLGNGCQPQTVAKAFTTLINRIIE